MVDIRPAYGPLTEEEFESLLEIETKRNAARAMMSDMQRIYEDTQLSMYTWWKNIRTKYEIADDNVYVDFDTQMIRHMTNDSKIPKMQKGDAIQ